MRRNSALILLEVGVRLFHRGWVQGTFGREFKFKHPGMTRTVGRLAIKVVDIST